MELQVQEQNWSQRWEDKEKQLQESRNIHLALEAEIQSLRLELSEQQQARAAAEEKNSWLNYLEEQLQRQKKELVHMQEENGRLQVLSAELKANLEEEKRKAEDNIALLKEARENLLTHSRALSAEALKNNNQAFFRVRPEHPWINTSEGAGVNWKCAKRPIDHCLVHTSTKIIARG